MSPRKEAREPVNENIGKGTGIGTLIPIYRTTKVICNHVSIALNTHVYVKPK